MTTSGLSPEAKEFVPIVQILPSIPVYVGENTIASVYSTEQQQQQPPPLIYPLIKISEIDFHIQSSQQSPTNLNPSQIVLLPTPGCYPGTQLPTFYPIDYSIPQPKINPITSYRSQRGNNHSSFRNPHYEQTSNNHRNVHPTNGKRISKGIHSRSIQQQTVENDNDIQFKFRAEDFPTLPINTEHSDKITIQSTDTKLVYIINSYI